MAGDGVAHADSASWASAALSSCSSNRARASASSASSPSSATWLAAVGENARRKMSGQSGAGRMLEHQGRRRRVSHSVASALRSSTVISEFSPSSRNGARGSGRLPGAIRGCGRRSPSHDPAAHARSPSAAGVGRRAGSQRNGRCCGREGCAGERRYQPGEQRWHAARWKAVKEATPVHVQHAKHRVSRRHGVAERLEGGRRRHRQQATPGNAFPGARRGADSAQAPRQCSPPAALPHADARPAHPERHWLRRGSPARPIRAARRRTRTARSVRVGRRRVSRSSSSAPCSFGRARGRAAPGVCRARTASSSTPAAWNTPANGGRSRASGPARRRGPPHRPRRIDAP